jgi:hypothetical protein
VPGEIQSKKIGSCVRNVSDGFVKAGSRCFAVEKRDHLSDLGAGPSCGCISDKRENVFFCVFEPEVTTPVRHMLVIFYSNGDDSDTHRDLPREE